MNSTRHSTATTWACPSGALILHYKTAEDICPATAGLAPVER
ncbi:MAG TPA: hypothetical protein VGH74_22865 [Planctomycetaceae bacterium]|jgi:hypothetical protein